MNQTITAEQQATIDEAVASWRSEYPDHTVEVSVKPGTLMRGSDFDVEVPVVFLNINVDTQPYMSFLACSIREDGRFVGDDPQEDWR